MRRRIGMGLDIYAGTLTRYYSKDWKTSIQRFAEDHGKAYSRVGPDGSEYDLGPEDPERYRDDIGEWMDYILESLERDGGGNHGRWNDEDGCPYYTGWPDWDGFGALLMVTACSIYGEPVPPTVKRGWAYHEEPLIDMLCGDYGENMTLLSGVTWWLPLPLRFIMDASKPYGEDVRLGTVSGLKGELREINRNVWEADEETILGWSSPESLSDNWMLGRMTSGESDTEELAKVTFSMFHRAVRFSEENDVPVVLNF